MAKFDGIFTAQEKRTAKPTARVTAKNVAAPVPPRTVGKRSDPSYTQTTAYIRKETHEAVMRALYKRREYSDLVEELLSGWLRQQK